MSEETITTVEAPSLNGENPWAIPLTDLKQAAGIDQPAPVAQPQSQVQLEPQSPAAASPSEPYMMVETPDGIELKLNTGEVFRGKDINELLPKLVKSKIDTTVWARQVRKQYDDFQQNPAQSVQMPQEPASPEMEAQAAMEQAKAVRDFILKDVLTPEAKASIVADVLQVPVEQLPQVLERYSTASENWQMGNALKEFHMACPEYVDLPEQGEALASTLVELHGGQIPRGYVPSAQELKIAWAVALREGRATPYVHRTPPPAPRPPIMLSAGAAPATGDQNAWTMDLNQLKKAAGLG